MTYNKNNQKHLDQEDVLLKWLKRGIWLYFYLLIFEGALRKWFLPFLSTPLLVVRDPIALGVMVLAWKNGYFKFNGYCYWMYFLIISSFITTLLFGHQSVFVAFFGARIFLIHFPFIFVISQILNRNDVLKIGYALLWISLLMIVVNSLQFYSPQSAWINRGVGGDMEGAGFSGANGYFRPPGTFSFTSGNVCFWSIVGTFVIYFWLSKEKVNKLLLILSSFALLLAIPLSIARGLFFQVFLTILFSGIGLVFNPRYLKTFILSLFFIALLVLVLQQLPFAQTSIEALTSRFETAQEQSSHKDTKTMVFHRVFEALIGGGDYNGLPFFGKGLGMGTNVAAKFLYGEFGFLVAEAETGRVIGEMGMLIGLSVMLLKIILGLQFSFKSWNLLTKGDFLPWMLLSYGLLSIVNGQMSSPTTLGFIILTVGLIKASFNYNEDNISSG